MTAASFGQLEKKSLRKAFASSFGQPGKSLFVDPVLCIAGPLPGLRQDRQILMPFISQQDATILPKAMGNPPILTIMALAKKIAALL